MIQNKLVIAAVVVFGVVGTLFLMTEFIQKAEKDNLELELINQTNKVKEAIREEIQNSKPANRNDSSDSLLYLESR